MGPTGFDGLVTAPAPQASSHQTASSAAPCGGSAVELAAGESPSRVDASNAPRRSPPARRGLLVAALQAAVTLALLGWIFSDGEVREGVARALAHSEAGWMALAVAAAGLCVLTGALRWSIFLRMQGFRISGQRVLSISLVGGFFNLFLFGSLGGDAAKVVCVTRESPGRHTPAILTILMDHMSGFGALLTLAVGFTFVRYDLFFASPLATGMLALLVLVLAVALGGLALGLAAARWRLEQRVWMPAPLRARATEVARAFDVLWRQWPRTLLATGVSLVVMVSHFVTFYCASRAVGGRSTLTEILTVMPVVDVMAALPVSISGLGVREKSVEELLGIIAGVPVETAVLISLGGFAATLAWSLLGGVVFLFYRPSGERIRLRDVRAELPRSGGLRG
jgi:glycosyltransferase 2 family protein